jgi:ribulose kinase
MSHYIGVDVGTTSARAGLFSKEGRLICAATHAIDVYKPKTDYYEHSSNNIWQVRKRHSKIIPKIED